MKRLFFSFISMLFLMLSISCGKSTVDNIFDNDCGGALSSHKVIISNVKKASSLTLKNEMNNTASLDNWKLVEEKQLLTGGTTTQEFVIPAGTKLGKCETKVFSAATLNFSLGADATVYLYDSQGTRISQMSWLSFSN